MLKNILIGVGTFIVVCITIFGMVVGYRYYSVWSMEMQGKAKLAEASQSRQIQVEQARGELEASKMRAEAIGIIGEAAQKYPEYRKQEFIGAYAEALKEGLINQIIYVPTEAQIPIMEAGKR